MSEDSYCITLEYGKENTLDAFNLSIAENSEKFFNRPLVRVLMDLYAIMYQKLDIEWETREETLRNLRQELRKAGVVSLGRRSRELEEATRITVRIRDSYNPYHAIQAAHPNGYISPNTNVPLTPDSAFPLNDLDDNTPKTPYLRIESYPKGGTYFHLALETVLEDKGTRFITNRIALHYTGAEVVALDLGGKNPEKFFNRPVVQVLMDCYDVMYGNRSEWTAEARAEARRGIQAELRRAGVGSVTRKQQLEESAHHSYVDIPKEHNPYYQVTPDYTTDSKDRELPGGEMWEPYILVQRTEKTVFITVELRHFSRTLSFTFHYWQDGMSIWNSSFDLAERIGDVDQFFSRPLKQVLVDCLGLLYSEAREEWVHKSQAQSAIERELRKAGVGGIGRRHGELAEHGLKEGVNWEKSKIEPLLNPHHSVHPNSTYRTPKELGTVYLNKHPLEIDIDSGLSQTLIALRLHKGQIQSPINLVYSGRNEVRFWSPVLGEGDWKKFFNRPVEKVLTDCVKLQHEYAELEFTPEIQLQAREYVRKVLKHAGIQYRGARRQQLEESKSVVNVPSRFDVRQQLQSIHGDDFELDSSEVVIRTDELIAEFNVSLKESIGYVHLTLVDKDEKRVVAYFDLEYRADGLFLWFCEPGNLFDKIENREEFFSRPLKKIAVDAFRLMSESVLWEFTDERRKTIEEGVNRILKRAGLLGTAARKQQLSESRNIERLIDEWKEENEWAHSQFHGHCALHLAWPKKRAREAVRKGVVRPAELKDHGVAYRKFELEDPYMSTPELKHALKPFQELLDQGWVPVWHYVGYSEHFDKTTHESLSLERLSKLRARKQELEEARDKLTQARRLGQQLIREQEWLGDSRSKEWERVYLYTVNPKYLNHMLEKGIQELHSASYLGLFSAKMWDGESEKRVAKSLELGNVPVWRYFNSRTWDSLYTQRLLSTSRTRKQQLEESVERQARELHRLFKREQALVKKSDKWRAVALSVMYWESSSEPGGTFGLKGDTLYTPNLGELTSLLQKDPTVTWQYEDQEGEATVYPKPLLAGGVKGRREPLSESGEEQLAKKLISQLKQEQAAVSKDPKYKKVSLSFSWGNYAYGMGHRTVSKPDSELVYSILRKPDAKWMWHYVQKTGLGEFYDEPLLSGSVGGRKQPLEEGRSVEYRKLASLHRHAWLRFQKRGNLYLHLVPKSQFERAFQGREVAEIDPRGVGGGLHKKVDLSGEGKEIAEEKLAQGWLPVWVYCYRDPMRKEIRSKPLKGVGHQGQELEEGRDYSKEVDQLISTLHREQERVDKEGEGKTVYLYMMDPEQVDRVLKKGDIGINDKISVGVSSRNYTPQYKPKFLSSLKSGWKPMWRYFEKDFMDGTWSREPMSKVKARKQQLEENSKTPKVQKLIRNFLEEERRAAKKGLVLSLYVVRGSPEDLEDVFRKEGEERVNSIFSVPYPHMLVQTGMLDRSIEANLEKLLREGWVPVWEYWNPDSNRKDFSTYLKFKGRVRKQSLEENRDVKSLIQRYVEEKKQAWEHGWEVSLYLSGETKASIQRRIDFLKKSGSLNLAVFNLAGEWEPIRIKSLDKFTLSVYGTRLVQGWVPVWEYYSAEKGEKQMTLHPLFSKTRTRKQKLEEVGLLSRIERTLEEAEWDTNSLAAQLKEELDWVKKPDTPWSMSSLILFHPTDVKDVLRGRDTVDGSEDVLLTNREFEYEFPGNIHRDQVEIQKKLKEGWVPVWWYGNVEVVGDEDFYNPDLEVDDEVYSTRPLSRSKMRKDTSLEESKDPVDKLFQELEEEYEWYHPQGAVELWMAAPSIKFEDGSTDILKERKFFWKVKHSDVRDARERDRIQYFFGKGWFPVWSYPRANLPTKFYKTRLSKVKTRKDRRLEESRTEKIWGLWQRLYDELEAEAIERGKAPRRIALVMERPVPDPKKTNLRTIPVNPRFEPVAWNHISKALFDGFTKISWKIWKPDGSFKYSSAYPGRVKSRKQNLEESREKALRFSKLLRREKLWVKNIPELKWAVLSFNFQENDEFGNRVEVFESVEDPDDVETIQRYLEKPGVKVSWGYGNWRFTTSGPVPLSTILRQKKQSLEEGQVLTMVGEYPHKNTTQLKAAPEGSVEQARALIKKHGGKVVSQNRGRALASHCVFPSEESFQAFESELEKVPGVTSIRNDNPEARKWHGLTEGLSKRAEKLVDLYKQGVEWMGKQSVDISLTLELKNPKPDVSSRVRIPVISHYLRDGLIELEVEVALKRGRTKATWIVRKVGRDEKLYPEKFYPEDSPPFKTRTRKQNLEERITSKFEESKVEEVAEELYQKIRKEVQFLKKADSGYTLATYQYFMPPEGVQASVKEQRVPHPTPYILLPSDHEAPSETAFRVYGVANRGYQILWTYMGPDGGFHYRDTPFYKTAQRKQQLEEASPRFLKLIKQIQKETKWAENSGRWQAVTLYLVKPELKENILKEQNIPFTHLDKSWERRGWVHTTFYDEAKISTGFLKAFELGWTPIWRYHSLGDQMFTDKPLNITKTRKDTSLEESEIEDPRIKRLDKLHQRECQAQEQGKIPGWDYVKVFLVPPDKVEGIVKSGKMSGVDNVSFYPHDGPVRQSMLTQAFDEGWVPVWFYMNTDNRNIEYRAQPHVKSTARKQELEEEENWVDARKKKRATIDDKIEKEYLPKAKKILKTLEKENKKAKESSEYKGVVLYLARGEDELEQVITFQRLGHNTKLVDSRYPEDLASMMFIGWELVWYYEKASGPNEFRDKPLFTSHHRKQQLEEKTSG